MLLPITFSLISLWPLTCIIGEDLPDIKMTYVTIYVFLPLCYGLVINHD